MLFPIANPYHARILDSWEVLPNRDLTNEQFGNSVSVSGSYAIVGAPLDDNKGTDSGAAYVYERNATSGLWRKAAKLTADDGQPGDQFGNAVAVSGSYAIVGAHLDDDKATDAGAIYIFERDTTLTWVQKIKLTASDGAASDLFGWSVAISGNYAIVGAHQDDDGGTSSGSAYIFERNTTTGVWAQAAKLIASDDAAGDQFGRSVAISGNYAIIGSPYDDDKGTNSGSAYVFERNTTTGVWAQAAKFTASDGAASDLFGFSVAVSGNYAIVGAFADDTSKGSAYVFERNTTTGVWAQAVKLTASDGAASDEFGRSVAISGNYAVVGSWLDDDGGTNSGSAYMFERNTTTGVWAQTTKIVAGDAVTVDRFGAAVAISGTYVISGAPLKDTNATDAGAAYTFERNATSGVWEQAEKLIPRDDFIGDKFGQVVAVSGNYAIIGAPLDSDRGASSGTVTFYERNATTGVWTRMTRWAAGDGGIGDFYGWSVSISGSYAVTGAFGNDDNYSDTGSIYIFVRNASTGQWNTATKINASDPAGSDNFGRAVSIDGDYVIVGAPYTDDKGSNSGSVYIFERNTTNNTWAEVIKLTASDGAADDQFGLAVAISGNYAIVGAPYDDGVGADSGSAYILERNATTGVWSQKAKITGTDTAAGDYFGWSVAIDGDYAVIGAYRNANSSIKTGSAYVFERNTTTGVWSQKTKLVASDRAVDDWFGYSVSVSGNLAVVSSFSDTAGTNVGAAYYFERNASTGVWSQKTKVVPSDGKVNDYFGQSVAISGTYSIVGAYCHDVAARDSGAAYAIEQNVSTGVWAQSAELAAMSDSVEFFGYSVAAVGNYAFVGAHYDDDRGYAAGAVYVYEYNSTTNVWTQTNKITAPDGDESDIFGREVSVNGNYLIIGGYGNDDDGLAASGSVYIYEKDATTNQWLFKAKLRPSDPSYASNFGSSVCISGNYAIIGAYRESTIAAEAGAAYIFERNTTTGVWTQKAKLIASDSYAGQLFGYSVSISGNYAVASAHGDSDSGTYSGAVYMFERNTTTGVWSQKQKLTAISPATNDYFGYMVSMSGNYLVVGSLYDDERGGNAGCAYVFQRNTTTNVWAHSERLMASDSSAGDTFGRAVHMSGNYIVVGANLDDKTGASNSGSAYLFERNAATNAWTQIAKMIASDGVSNDQFGTSVALTVTGGYVIVGAPFRDDDPPLSFDGGAAYIYKFV